MECGTPNLEMTLLMKLSARSSALQVFLAGIYRDIFEKRSTITRIASYTALLFLLGGRSVIKSMEISCQGPSRTGNGCSAPWGRCRLAFANWHLAHMLTLWLMYFSMWTQ